MKRMLTLLAIIFVVAAGGLRAQTVNIVAHPQYTPADSTTPFALYVAISCTTAYARARIYDYAGMTTGIDYTWGDTTNALIGPNYWTLSNATSYAENVKLTMTSGTWAGWMFAKVSGTGDDTLSQIRVRFRQQQSTGTILSTNYTDTDSAKHLVMDPSITGRLHYGGWLKGHIYSDAGTTAPYSSIAVLAMRTDSIVGIYITENNHVDETYDSTNAGYFRMAVPEGQIDSVKYFDMTNASVSGYTKTSAPWTITRGVETDIDITGIEGKPADVCWSGSLAISAYPNPARNQSRISFNLPSAANVELSVFNIAGQKVAALASGPMNAGNHSIQWNTGNVPNGVYFYQLQAGNRMVSQKIVVIK